MKKENVLSIALFTFIVFSNLTLHGQTDQLNLEKYWHYRYRLVNYFMIVGPDLGNSIPANGRNIFGEGTIEWGEEPRYIGWYLGVLATEYKLLEMNGEDLNQTAMELYYALTAIKRLDETAEVYWGHAPEPPNGLMLRGDADDAVVKANLQKLNHKLPPGTPGWIPNSGKPTTVDGSHYSPTGHHKSVPSQDMLSELLCGLALIKKCLPDKTIDIIDLSNNIQHVNLRKMAIDHTNLIITYYRNDDKLHGPNKWQIYTPDGEAVPNGDGGDLSFFSYGFAKAAEYIVEGADYTAGFDKKQYWQFLGDQFNPAVNFIHRSGNNNHIILSLAAVGDSWHSVIFGNKTKEKIQYHADYGTTFGYAWVPNHYGWDLYYGSLHRYLHDYSAADDPEFDLCNMKYILDAAPEDGPYFHAFTKIDDPAQCDPATEEIAGDGWGCSLRFSVEPNADAPQDNGQCHFRGNFSGLDYMLFHNLYYLNNLNGELFSGNFPHHKVSGCDHIAGIHDIGSVESPKTFKNTEKHIKVDDLNVGMKTENCILGDRTYAGDVRIIGGPGGVTLTNTKTTYGAYLTVRTESGCGVDPVNYLFIPSAYMKQGATTMNVSTLTLPPFVKSEEFKQLENDKMIISPNPNGGIFTLQLDNGGQSLNILVFNNLGEIVHSQLLNSQISQINLSSQPKGIYIIKAQSWDKLYTKKVVLQ